MADVAPSMHVAQADAYFESGEWVKARGFYERYLHQAKIVRDVVGMALVFGRIGKTYNAARRTFCVTHAGGTYVISWSRFP